jgi:FkbM family methyltransferase
MIPKIFHLCYSEQKITSVERSYVKKLKDLHPKWTFMEWVDPIKPEGFELSGLWKHCSSGAQLADLVRVEVLYRFGGVYIDVDFDVVKPFDQLLDLEFFVGTEDGVASTNAVFGSIPKHPALAAIMEELRRFGPEDLEGLASHTTGPALFQRLLQFRKDVCILPRETFYPYNWNEAEKKEFHHMTLAAHKWHGSWLKGRGHAVDQSISRKVRKAIKRVLKYCRFRTINVLSRARILPLYRPPSYSAANEVVVQTVHGHYLWVDARQIVISPELICTGTYELKEELFFRRWLSGGDHIVDVGANVGVLSILAAAQVGPMGRVYAYEPNPAMSALLKKSIVTNWLQDRIRLEEKGVGEEKGALSLHLNPCVAGGGSLLPNRGEVEESGARELLPATQEIEVGVVALDDEIHPACRIRLIKIDVEGFEAFVLRGMRKLIERRQVDAVMLEAAPGIAGAQWDDIFAQLKNLVAQGYVAHSLADMGRLEPVELRRSRMPGGRNLVFVESSVLKEINREIS